MNLKYFNEFNVFNLKLIQVCASMNLNYFNEFNVFNSKNLLCMILDYINFLC